MAGLQDNTIILLDVGANTNDKDVDGKRYYDEAKRCIEAIITRKIFSKPKDEIALFLLGTGSTDNDLNKERGGYENIQQALPLEPMSWDMLKFVEMIDPPSDSITANWFDAIIVALDYFHRLELKKGFKKILLFTTFSTVVGSENVKPVISSLQSENVELIVVAQNITFESAEDSEDPYPSFSQSLSKSKSKMQEHSEELIKEIVLQSNGILSSIDDVITKLIFVDKKRKRRVPWNADLTIGTKFSIKISAYIYVRDEKELDTWKTRLLVNIPKNKVTADLAAGSDDAVTNTTGESSSTKVAQVFAKTEIFHNDEVIDPDEATENLIKGYMYGGEAFPFEDEKYDNGGKGLLCIGFTNVNTIGEMDLAADSIWAVVPQKNMDVSAKKFASLLKVMENLNYAMIARYTYRDGTAPKLMALFPAEDSLNMHELLFKENYVTIEFPRLVKKSTTPSAEQYNFMDKFIDSMDLMCDDNKEQPCEYFENLMDPGLQHAYRAIAHRAIHPNEPMIELDKEILSLVTPPKSKQVDTEKFKELFPLKVPQKTTKEAFMENLLKIDKEKAPEQYMPEIKSDYCDIHEIGTIKPAEDFVKLLKHGEPFNLLSAQVQNVIINLAVKSIIAMDEKVLQALLTYRETAKEKAPYKYNEWINTFKDLLKQREKVQLWQSLSNENLGLITSKESEISTVSEEEAMEFYQMDDFSTQSILMSTHEMGDQDTDMFDEM